MKVLMTGCKSGFGHSVRMYLKHIGMEVVGVGLNGPDMHLDLNTLAHDPYMQDRTYEWIVKTGPYDALINNAGVLEMATFQTYTPQQFTSSIDVNLISPFLMMRSFYMAHRDLAPSAGHFRIINTTALSIRHPPVECPGFVASKAGLEAVTRALARELAGKGKWILACIAPGLVDLTPTQQHLLRRQVYTHGIMPEDAQEQQRATPMGRLIQHDEMAAVFRFALLDLPPAMSGTTLTVPLASGL